MKKTIVLHSTLPVELHSTQPKEITKAIEKIIDIDKWMPFKQIHVYYTSVL